MDGCYANYLQASYLYRCVALESSETSLQKTLSTRDHVAATIAIMQCVHLVSTWSGRMSLSSQKAAGRTQQHADGVAVVDKTRDFVIRHQRAPRPGAHLLPAAPHKHQQLTPPAQSYDEW